MNHVCVCVHDQKNYVSQMLNDRRVTYCQQQTNNNMWAFLGRLEKSTFDFQLYGFNTHTLVGGKESPELGLL